MKRAERVAGPTIGVALAYFTVKYGIASLEWLAPEDQLEAVSMLAILYHHIIMEARIFLAYLKGRYNGARRSKD